MRTVRAEPVPSGTARRRPAGTRGGVRTVLPALVAAGALVLAGCDDSDDAGDDPPNEENAEDLQVPEHDDPAPEPDEEDTEPSAESEPDAETEPEPEAGDEPGAEPDEDSDVGGQDSQPPLTLAGPTWHVRTVTVEGETVRADDEVTAEISFAESNDTMGVQACNGISGTAAGASDGDVLTLGLGTSTLMACPGLQGQIEDAMRDFLEGEAAYGVNGDELTLSKDNGDTMVLVGVS